MTSEQLQQRIETLEKALRTIYEWNDFPETGQFWDSPENSRPVSYGAAYGSNGQRDYMRNVAFSALEDRPKEEPPR